MLISLVPQFLSADFSAARDLEKSGDLDGAIEAYHDIVGSRGEMWCKALRRLAYLPGDVEDILELLQIGIVECESPVDRRALMIAAASTFELAGDIRQAQSLYQQASFAVPDQKSFESLLASAQLLYELGDYRGAAAQARAIADTANRRSFVPPALVLLSRVYFATDHNQKSVEAIRKVLSLYEDETPPGALLWAYTLGNLVDEEALADGALLLLREHYPASPELAVAEGKAGKLPSPSVFLGLETTAEEDETTREPVVEVDLPEPVVGIQTGSYSVEENAQYASRDVSDAGFANRIVEIEVNGKTYYRVVLENVRPDNVDELILKLKEKGFEGFKIFD